MSDIKIIRGDTYRDTLRWATSECVLIPAALVPGAPVRLTATAHGIPDGWPARIEGVRDIDESKQVTLVVVDADTLEIACINGSRFKAGACVIRINKPVDLTGFEARMHIRDHVGGTVLMELTSAAASGEPRIIIDDAAATIVREIPADVTADIEWCQGVFDLEMVSGAYVKKIDAGCVAVRDEVTA